MVEEKERPAPNDSSLEDRQGLQTTECQQRGQHFRALGSI